MKRIHINEKEYLNKVYGGWLGKNIGGTLGGPVEGKKELLDLTFYPQLSDGPMPNDDLDLQLVWLHAVEQYGARLTSRELGQEWVEHVFFPFDEYGYALANLRRGLKAPVAGWYNNPFTNCMGSPIRSEIWAMIAPGAPATAAWYAYQDAIVDHAGGEGVYGEMFYAAIESAAFVHKDINQLLDIGLRVIPSDSRTFKAVQDLRKWHGEGKNWVEARELILKHHGHSNFTDAPQNIAFTVLGWLYGENFGDAILKAVNCGYDTDCTGATLGAILGMIEGADRLPDKWVKPVGNKIAVSPPVKGFTAPEDLEELTQRTLACAREVLGAWNLPIDITMLSNTISYGELYDENGFLKQEKDPSVLWNTDFQGERYYIPAGTGCKQSLEVLIDYGLNGPSIGQNQSKSFTLTICNNSKEFWEGVLSLTLPNGWKGPQDCRFALAPSEDLKWDITVTSDEKLNSSYPIQLCVQRDHDGSQWSRNSITFYLVPACRWIIKGPNGNQEHELICSGNRIEFEKVFPEMNKGKYKARTTIRNSKDRQIRLIVATEAPVKVMLDGELIIEDHNPSEFMPAFHRVPANRRSEFYLTSGDHVLDIELEIMTAPLEVYVLPVSTGKTSSPGPYYYLTDVLFM